jgi:hypothetical protein
MTYDSDTKGSSKKKKKSSGKKLYGIAKPATPEYVNAVLNGMLMQGTMGGNTTPPAVYNIEPQTTIDGAGGPEMRQEPPTTMVHKPSGQMRVDNSSPYPVLPMPQQSSSTDALTELAMSMLTQPGASYDYESAMQDAAQGIRKAYGAEIAAIRSNNKAERKQTKRSRKEIEHLYKGLANQLGAMSDQALTRGQTAANQQTELFNGGNTILQDLNNQMIQDESNLMAGLGLQDAIPALTNPDYDRMAQQVADNTGFGQRAASAELQRGNANSRYLGRSQAGAAYEGADQSARLLMELNDYLRQNRDQIGILKGNRAKEIGASNANISAQAAQMAADQNSQQWDQVMQLLNTVAANENTNFDNQLAANKFQWDQGMDTQQFNWKQKLDKRKLKLDQMRAMQQDQPDPYAAYNPQIADALKIISSQHDPHDQQAWNNLMKLFGDNAFKTDQVDLGHGNSVKLTPFQAMAMARKRGQEMGLQGKELSDFVMAAAAAVGR